nr:uncharacterized protein K02A2.6-like [Lepeophtheirus salmonis]
MAYVRRRDCLSLRNGLLFWGIRLMVPKSLRRMCLDELPLNHLTMVKMKTLTRNTMWWPGMDQDIETFVQACKVCQELSSNPPSEFTLFPLSSEWQRVHINSAQFRGRFILVMMNAGSKLIETDDMKDTSTLAMLKQLFKWYTCFVFPRVIQSDNGPEFTSAAYRSKSSE